MEIAPGVHQIEGMGFSNAFLVIGERLTLVDTGVKGKRRAIEEYVRSLGRYPVEIDQVVITHAHADHMGSVAEMRRRYRFAVAAHEADAPYVEGRLPLPKPDRGPLLGVLFGAVGAMNRTEPAEVDVLLQDGSTVGPEGDIQVIHTPGHTPGSICLYMPDRRVLLTGDAVINRRDRMGTSPAFFSLDTEQARASVLRLAGLEVEAIGFGHGPAVTRDAGARLRELVERVAGTLVP